MAFWNLGLLAQRSIGLFPWLYVAGQFMWGCHRWCRSMRSVLRNSLLMPEFLVIQLRFSLTSVLIRTALSWLCQSWICLMMSEMNCSWGFGLIVPCLCSNQYCWLKADWDPMSTCWLSPTWYPDNMMNLLSSFPQISMYAHCPRLVKSDPWPTVCGPWSM